MTCHLFQKLGARYINTLEAQRVDPVAIEEEFKFTSIWSDMEKCIFLDRFLQFPKDFRKISTFLRNKNTKDCVRFYYDSKQHVPYKAALKEHMMRRKRRGDYAVWDATIQAALSVGAIVKAGPSEQKPLVFALPDNDATYWTTDFHPLQRSLFDEAGVGAGDPEDFDEDEYESAGKVKSGKPSLRYRREPFFNLAKEEKKFVKTKSKGPSGEKDADSIPPKKMKPVVEEEEPPVEIEKTSVGATPPRKPPQKWTAAEKKIFVETLEKHGKPLRVFCVFLVRRQFCSTVTYPVLCLYAPFSCRVHLSTTPRSQLGFVSVCRWLQDNLSDKELLL